MGAQPAGPQPAHYGSAWPVDQAVCNRSYLLAGVRAGVITLILLAILTIIVLV